MRTSYSLINSNRTVHITALALLLFLLHQDAPCEQKGDSVQQGVALASLSTFSNSSRTAFTESFGEYRVLELSRSDHITLLKLAMENYRKKVRDYTTVLYKRERINGKLKSEQKISVWFKDRPFSLVMKWLTNPGTIDKLLYVEGRHNNKMIVHPTGFFSWVKSVKRDPRCKDAKLQSRRFCDQFGIYRGMENMLEVYERAQRRNDLQMRCLGRSRMMGRECVAMERLLPAGKGYPSARMVMYFDLEHLVPISSSSYDWQGNLISRYTFDDLEFNVGLTSGKFTPKANRL